MSTALLVIAPYNDFLAAEGKVWPYLREVAQRLRAVPNMRDLVAGAKRLQPFVRGSWGTRFHDDFSPQPEDIVAQEHWLHSGFAATDLDYRLRMRGIDRFVICGMRANACLEATARWGVELGYHVTIARDATAAFRWEEWAATIETNAPSFAHEILPAEEIVRRFAQEGV